MRAALDAVHHAGLLHLDVKADNIMLMKGPALRLKLVDFGLARPKHATEASFEVDGTPEFMSPEQMASCDSVDERSDTFGLAVCLYHALTGAMPFAGTGICELWVAISRGELHPASSVRAELRPAVDHFFSRALAYDKGARFSGTADMQSAFLEATELAHVPITRVLPMVRPRPRSRRAWIAAMVCAVALVGAVVFLRTGDRPSLAAADVPHDPTGERLDAGASDARR